MSRFNEILQMIDTARSDNDLELILILTDDGCYCGTISNDQCCRIYDLLNQKNLI